MSRKGASCAEPVPARSSAATAAPSNRSVMGSARRGVGYSLYARRYSAVSAHVSVPWLPPPQPVNFAFMTSPSPVPDLSKLRIDRDVPSPPLRRALLRNLALALVALAIG